MKKLLFIFISVIMTLSLVACNSDSSSDDDDKSNGGTHQNSDKDNDDDSGSGGVVSRGDYKGKYTFNPPTDNYYIETDTFIEAVTDNKYTYIDKVDSDYTFHVNYTTKKIWRMYEDEWILDTEAYFPDYEETKDSPSVIFNEMELGLVGILRAFGTEEDELGKKLKDYYIENEEIAGVDCFVFDSKGVNNIHCKYWIHPDNGAVLKYVYYEDTDGSGASVYTEEVKKYNDNYKKMASNLLPEESSSDKDTDEDKDKDEDKTEGSKPDLDDIDFEAILSGDGSEDIIWSELDDDTKEALIDEAKKEGVDVSFDDDGNMTIVDSESGSTVVQKPDGSWVVKNDDGSIGQLGGDWPKNEFTKFIPKPDFAILASNTSDTEFSVAFTGITTKDVKDYAKELMAAGFTISPETIDEVYGDLEMYSYIAKNSDGYEVNISYAMGSCALMVTKP